MVLSESPPLQPQFCPQHKPGDVLGRFTVTTELVCQLAGALGT